MEEIAALNRIIDRLNAHQNFKPNFPFFDPNENTKEMQLLRGIREGKFQSDKEAGEVIYGEGWNGHTFKNLKGSVQGKLLKYLFFIEIENKNFTISYKMELECTKLFYLGKLAFLTGEYNIATTILKKGIKLAIKYDFIVLLVSLCELLCSAYMFLRKSKYYKKVHEDLKIYRAKYNKYLEAKDIASEVVLFKISKSIKVRKENLENISKAVDRLNSLWIETNSLDIFDLYYRLNISSLEMRGNFKELIKFTEKIETQFQYEIAYKKRVTSVINKSTLVYALLRSGDYTKGINKAKKFLDYINPTPSFWANYMDNYFLLAVHGKKYSLAVEILKDTLNNPSFKNVHTSQKETWSLNQAYLYFIHPDKSLLQNFNFDQFLDEVPEYTKDKEGFNVAILILQCLNFFRKKDIDSLLYRVEALRKYQQKHLQSQFSLRTRLFFKLLFAAVKASMMKEHLPKHVPQTLEKLKNTPTPGDAYAEIEIIPYEHLWEMIYDMM